MSNLRKGSIVWDRNRRIKTKILNSFSKGEVSDRIFQIIGRPYSNYFRTSDAGELNLTKLALCQDEEGTEKCNNQPCYLTVVHVLIPYKEYLKT